jgi:uncharacterized membrane protein YfcA
VSNVSRERLYPVRRPVAVFLAGAAVAILGGLIGLGGAEFRLPLLIAVFELFPHRAIRINLLISLATLAVAAIARLGFAQAANLGDYTGVMVAMLAGGIVAAWIGTAVLKHRIVTIIAGLLVAIAGLLVLETVLAGSMHFVLPPEHYVRLPAALAAGLVVGAITSLLGVAGPEGDMDWVVYFVEECALRVRVGCPLSKGTKRKSERAAVMQEPIPNA